MRQANGAEIVKNSSPNDGPSFTQKITVVFPQVSGAWWLALLLAFGFAISSFFFLHTKPHSTNQLQVLPVKNDAGINSKREVHVGFYVNRLGDIDVKSSTFFVDTYVWFRWKGEKQDQLRFEFLNGKNIKVDDFGSQGSFANGEHHRGYKVSGTFQSYMNHKNYPLDTQTLDLQIEDSSFGIKELQFVPDSQSKIAEDLNVGLWTMIHADIKSDVRTYKTNFGELNAKSAESQYSRLTASFKVQRMSASILLKSLLPLYIVILIAGLAFFVDAQFLPVRTQFAVLSLLTAITFHTMASSSALSLGYLTWLDRYFLLAYFMIFSVILSVVVFTRLEFKDTKAAKIASEKAGFIYFITTFIATALIPLLS